MNRLIFITLLIFSVSCSSKKSEKLSKIKLLNNTYSFNPIKYGDTIKYKFKIKNIGENPLIIENIGSSCGCVISSYSKTPILKNNFAEINVIFTPKKNQYGKIKKTLLVKCNIDSTYIPLYIEGFVLGNSLLNKK